MPVIEVSLVQRSSGRGVEREPGIHGLEVKTARILIVVHGNYGQRIVRHTQAHRLPERRGKGLTLPRALPPTLHYPRLASIHLRTGPPIAYLEITRYE